jgi:hypothetical protein
VVSTAQCACQAGDGLYAAVANFIYNNQTDVALSAMINVLLVPIQAGLNEDWLTFAGDPAHACALTHPSHAPPPPQRCL